MAKPKTLWEATERLRLHNNYIEEQTSLAWKGSLERLRLRTEAQAAHNNTVETREKRR